jgi:hypothetical protein
LEAAFWPTFLAVEKGMVAAGETVFYLLKYKTKSVPFGLLKKGIVHIMDYGMPSIQGCIIDGRHGCASLGCVGN